MANPLIWWRFRKIPLLCCSVLFLFAVLNLYLPSYGPHVTLQNRSLLSADSKSATFVKTTAAVTVSDNEKMGQKTMQDELSIEKLEMQLHLLKQEIIRLKKSPQLATTIQKMGAMRRHMSVKYQNESNRKRILVTGGAGFVGSHLVDRLMLAGHEVIALDNYFTGRKRNVEHWIGHPNFELVHHDVVNSYYTEVNEIYHLASPASPPHYMYNPVKTIKTNTIGTINMLGLARRLKARMLLASTSEIYGDPEKHPQPETYWGRVNSIGPRSCYDEGKRVAESLMVAYHVQENVDIRIARIFNTFGPRMHMDDGRVVSNFILQALRGDPITIYGDGKQTRSFQYVDDLVTGLIKLMEANYTEPVNIGNPEEQTINEFAELIRNLVGSNSSIVHRSGQPDDPRQRKPDITRAAKILSWKPKVSVRDGLLKTIDYFREELEYDKMMLKKGNEEELEMNGRSNIYLSTKSDIWNMH